MVQFNSGQCLAKRKENQRGVMLCAKERWSVCCCRVVCDTLATTLPASLHTEQERDEGGLVLQVAPFKGGNKGYLEVVLEVSNEEETFTVWLKSLIWNYFKTKSSVDLTSWLSG